MSNAGRQLVQELKNGNYAAVDENQDLTDLDIKMVNHYARELFTLAIEGKDRHLLDALMRIPGIIVSTSSYCALRHAVKKGAEDMVQAIAQAPAIRPNMPEPSGNTALILAVTGKWSEKKALEMVAYILNIPGVEINFRGENKQTALHHTVTRRWYKVAQYLMDNGGNPKIYDESGASPLEKAMLANDLPSELFTSMLSFTPPAPVEEIIRAMETGTDTAEPEEEKQSGPVLSPQSNFFGQPSQIPVTYDDDVLMGQMMPQYDDDDDDDQPPVQKAQPQQIPQDQQTPVAPPPQDQKKDVNSHSYYQPAPPVEDTEPPKVQTQSQPQSVDDAEDDMPGIDPVTGDMIPISREKVEFYEESFLSALGVKDMNQLEKNLTLDALFTSPDGAHPALIQLPEVLAGFDKLYAILEKKGKLPTAAQCSERDPLSGDSLWVAAAKNGLLEKVVNNLSRSGIWPEEADFLSPDLSGRNMLQVMEHRGELKTVLSARFWNGNPELQVHLIGRLSKAKRDSLRPVITRAHLIMLERAMQ